MKLIERNMQTIIALCQMYKVNKLFVFGSILTERFNKESDIDFLEEQAIKNPYLRKSVDSSKMLIYERAS